MNREEIVAELRRVAELLGRQTFSRSEFKRHGRVSSALVEQGFGTWNKALEAAGLVPIDRFKRIADSELDEEWRRVHKDLGKVPTRNEFVAQSRFSAWVYENRFGNWQNVVAHYLGPQATRSGAAPCEPHKPPVASRPPVRAPLTRSAPEVAKGKRVFGPPLNFRGLRHEPVNEQGVVLLFGMVAHDLGFLVEGVRTGYPDCSAKQQIKGGYYVDVNIEFEFKSSHFREHGHDPDKSDLIVCWEHDWPDCPIDVLELREEIRRLQG